MKKQTKSQKCNDYFTAFKATQAGQVPKRQGAKDNSTPTHPVVSVPALSEAEVLKDCLNWLRKRGILCDRNNVGSGQIGESGFYSYGIKNGGDIIGALPTGQHFEIECKRGKGGRLSLGQQKRMNALMNNNCLCFIVHGWQELEYYFKREGII